MSYYFFKSLYCFMVLFPFMMVWFLYQVSNIFLQKCASLLASFLIFFSSMFMFLIYLNKRFIAIVGFLPLKWFPLYMRERLSPLRFTMYFDYTNLYLLLLTGFILCLVIYYLNNTVFVEYNYFAMAIFFLWGVLNLLFCTTNLLLFYFLFELSLLPMFMIIGRWGNRLRRVHAAVFFVMYTSILSFLFLVVILLLYYWVDSVDFIYLRYYAYHFHFQIDTTQFSWFWLLAMIAFCAKLPLFPFHIWLPEAHVEAPTVGSVILASMLLKVGAYAMMSFLLPFGNPYDLNFFGNNKLWVHSVIKTIAWVSLFYSTVITFSQIDLKKIIAYTSIVHMSLFMIGSLSYSVYGVRGGYLMLIAHGFSSAGLFFVAGMLYSSFGTRLLKYYSGVHLVTPKLSSFAFFFFLANIGFPGTLNFISEFLILLGVVHFWGMFFIGLFGFCFVGSLVYSIWIYNKIFLGTFKIDALCTYYDLFRYEQNMLTILAFATIFFGLFPDFML